MNVHRRENQTWQGFLKNTISAQLHLLGMLLAIAGLSVLLHLVKSDDHASFVACLIFGGTAIAVFAVSSLYHFLSDGFHASAKLEALFEKLDHFSIYSFIAGSYTAILINTLSPKWQTPMLILIWSGTVLGILYTMFRAKLPQWLQGRAVYTSIFVLLGWGLVLRIGEVYHNLSGLQLFLLMAGVMAYSGGAVVYATKKPKLFPGVFGFHELWHLCVVLGFSFHYALVLQFYL